MKNQTQSKQTEVLTLAEEILRDLEASRSNLRDTYLKTARLMRITGNAKIIPVCLSDTAKVAQLESTINSSKLQLAQSADPSGVQGFGNKMERSSLREQITRAEHNWQAFKNALYEMVLEQYYSLRFVAIPRQIFDSIQEPTEARLRDIAPEVLEDFVSAYDDLRSANSTD